MGEGEGALMNTRISLAIVVGVVLAFTARQSLAQTAEEMTAELLTALKPFGDLSERFKKVAEVSVLRENSADVLCRSL